MTGAGALGALLEMVERCGAGGGRGLDAALWCAIGSAADPTLDSILAGYPLPPSYEILGLTMARFMERWPDGALDAAKAWKVPRLTSSLDATVALIVRCFPHGWWAIEGDCGNDHTAFTGKVGQQEEDEPSCGDAPTPALALVAALLRALIAQAPHPSR